MKTQAKLAALRGLMKKQGLSAYLIPSTDPHHSEYVPDCWRRRQQPGCVHWSVPDR